MKRGFLLLLCVFFVLNGTSVALAQSEPDWYPVKSITPEMATRMIEVFTRLLRLIGDDEYVLSHVTSYPAWNTTPVVSLWNGDIRLAVEIDSAASVSPIDVSADLGSILSFLPDELPVHLTTTIKTDNQDSLFGANLLIEYSESYGKRDPYFDNPLRRFGHFDSISYPVLCGLVCRTALLEPFAGFGALSSDGGDQALRMAESRQSCCRIVERNGGIIGGLFYNNTGLSLSQMTATGSDAQPSSEQRYYGELRRLILSAAAGLGVRHLEPGGASFLLEPSPGEIIKASEQRSTLSSTDIFVISSGVGERTPHSSRDVFGVCRLGDHPYHLTGLTRNKVVAETTDVCLVLHRAVAVWRRLASAGIIAGTRPIDASRVLLSLSHNH